MDELKMYGLFEDGDFKTFVKFPHKPKICHFGIVQDKSKKYEIHEIDVVIVS